MTARKRDPFVTIKYDKKISKDLRNFFLKDFMIVAGFAYV